MIFFKKNIPIPPPAERRTLRRALNRRVSIGLAIFTGLVLGAGIWVIMDRWVLTPTPESQQARSDSPPRVRRNPAHISENLIPHRALYEISLISSKNASQLININGKMFFKLQRGCHGYITDHRFNLNYDYADSNPLRITSDFSTVESLDGKNFDFSARRRRDGTLYEEVRGTATHEGTDGQITYTDPTNTTLPLAPDVLFPAAHTRALIAAALSGKKFLASTTFDGSDDQGPVDVTAIITAPVPSVPAKETALGTSGHQEDPIDPALLSGRAWKMRLAFFPKTASDTSDYELTMKLYENGIISEMTIDYADFTVLQKLVALEPLAPEVCDTPPSPAPVLPKNDNTKNKPSEAKPVPNLPLR